MGTSSYIELHRRGELERRAEEARRLRIDDGCHLCPRECSVEHVEGERGDCGIGDKAVVTSVGPHFGEEPCLVGQGGSGTIFFAGCNLHCVFCQNSDISQDPEVWREVGPQELAAFMLSLQARGVENLNFVSPSHLVVEILGGLALAVEAGLTIPLVYNSSGYDGLRALGYLDGVVDIYMPDLKYSDSEAAEMCSAAPDYPEVARAAITEMHRQVGDLEVDERGVAVRGLLVRLLVLPGGLAGTAESVRFLAEEISRDTAVNVMDQYRPAFRARAHPPLDRRVTREEYSEARRIAKEAGLRLVDEI
jgi:putative pyruvate formate lyase activating enzyme